MTDYEILLMLDPELPEERQTEIVTRAREAIERDGGTFDKHYNELNGTLGFAASHLPEAIARAHHGWRSSGATHAARFA